MIKQVMAGAGLYLAASVPVGIGMELNSNEIALGKITTVETCVDMFGEADIISQKMLDCIEDGVPGGNNVEQDVFAVGDPVEYTNPYIEQQRTDASAVKVGEVAINAAVVIGSSAPIIAALCLLAFAVKLDGKSNSQGKSVEEDDSPA